MYICINKKNLYLPKFQTNKMAEFSFNSKSRLTLKEFEIVNTSDYNIAGHYGGGKQAEVNYKVEIIKEDVSAIF